MDQEGTLILPEFCDCRYVPEKSLYQCRLDLANSTTKKIYFTIISTFGFFMEISNAVSNLAYSHELHAHKKLELNIKIKPTNQIYKNGEYIRINYSHSPVDKYFSTAVSTEAKILLKFEGDIIEDEQIQQLLKSDAEGLIQQASKCMSEGKFQKANHLYEESFLLYRKNSKALLGMAQAHLEIGEVQKSLSSLQLCLFLCEKQDRAEFLKTKIMLNYYSLPEFSSHQVKYNLVKQMIERVGKIEKAEISEKQKEYFQEELEKLLKAKQQLMVEENKLSFQRFLARAVEQFSNHEALSQYFSNSQEFSRYLEKEFRDEDGEIQETPEYALDPINYVRVRLCQQIFRDPVIVPTGTSYEAEFMKKFMEKNGPQDPYTHNYLNPASIIQNITLKILVRNNPDLHKWIKYENEATRL